ncbi:probable selenium-dependent hydroxylase accessory protein YqeC [Oscillibacter sp. PC13]|uniref:selenium cofactor biosynthesis protein YqeC n=1 Tax=Oscillibacter sp. PC13 TaxID=1855299 RepID=UPI0008E34C6E|nr:selenium cofactor biosynthesis protein YqeC [Oscillibacter sp. PC13]SFP95462.1 probable selenium-dependent hydroxylase accessory protein YqeC [Oscillibacter sp. PC13]
MGLADLLEIQPGVTAVIGSGGKSTLLQALGRELAVRNRVLLCTTTRIRPFPQIPCARTVADLEALRREHRLLCAGTPVPDSGKLTAPESSVLQLAAWFDYVLIEADGSAQRPMKAHAPYEPVIPEEANQIICVVGASGFGKPIVEAAHRPERYARLANTEETAPVTPETEAAVLLVERLHHRVLVNQAETLERLYLARDLADRLDCPVLAGSLQRGVYEECL